MKRMALILAPASVAYATVALSAGLGFDGVSPQRVCYADFHAADRGDGATQTKPYAHNPLAPRADRCGTRPEPETSRS